MIHGISPEVIETRVNKYLQVKTYKQEVERITKSYYHNKSSVASSMAKKITDVLDSQHQQTSNIQTTGLDFGIITNNVGSAVLYGAMNNKAHQNQYNAQLNPILRNTNNQLDSLKWEMTANIGGAYNTYKRELKEYVKKKLEAEAKLH